MIVTLIFFLVGYVIEERQKYFMRGVIIMSTADIMELRERIVRLEARVDVLERKIEHINNYLRELYNYIQRALSGYY